MSRSAAGRYPAPRPSRGGENRLSPPGRTWAGAADPRGRSNRTQPLRGRTMGGSPTARLAARQPPRLPEHAETLLVARRAPGARGATRPDARLRLVAVHEKGDRDPALALAGRRNLSMSRDRWAVHAAARAAAARGAD